MVRTDPQGCHHAQYTQSGFRLKWKDLRSRVIKVLEESANNFSVMYYMIKILNMKQHGIYIYMHSKLSCFLPKIGSVLGETI